TIFPTHASFSKLEEPLESGDEIVAINGMPIHSADALMKEIQTKRVNVVVQRSWQPTVQLSWNEADEYFDKMALDGQLSHLENNIGSPHQLATLDSFVRLKPIVPKTRRELTVTQEKVIAKGAIGSEIEQDKQAIKAIDNPEKRAQALKFLETRENQLMLGFPGQDLRVNYNPNPIVQFEEITDDVMSTLTALIGGYLNPKWISGPVGIVQVVQSQWMLGLKEALFWLGIISLNLGLLNLLPLPILDGGYIALALFETVTGVRLQAKQIEKIVVPFAILLIAFLVFLTYNDLMRVVGNVLSK
ncbi:MAG TPA: site-2 protease family protein, partial [Chlamydiales bacterium]|nr:site-2 protease family protein [Chlamydiales bacterium]